MAHGDIGVWPRRSGWESAIFLEMFMLPFAFVLASSCFLSDATKQNHVGIRGKTGEVSQPEVRLANFTSLIRPPVSTEWVADLPSTTRDSMTEFSG